MIIKFILLLFFTRIYPNKIQKPKIPIIFTTDEYSMSLSSGFLGFKTFYLLQKCCKNTDENTKNLVISNIFWFLLKLNLKIERYQIKSNRSISISIRSFNYDYNHYYIPIGCINGYPGEHCIFKRVGWFGLGLGFDFFYNDIDSKYTFSQSLTFIVNVIAKKVIPLDFIFSYSPFIFSIRRGIYLELNLINFSLGSFIKSFIMTFVKLEKQLKANWEILEYDSTAIKREKDRYSNKVRLLQNSGIKEKVKFILYDNLLWALLHNIRIFIGVKY